MKKILLFVLPFFFVSCDKDSNNNNGNNNDEERVVNADELLASQQFRWYRQCT